jgi:rhodanese-related sulfurtransferase
MGLLNLFKRKDMSAEIKEYLEKGAVVLDVRTKSEWDEGHTTGAEHIVLTTIPLEVEKIKSWNKPVIAVCRSGARSGQATQFLKNNGVDVINGGPWQNVDQFFD